MLFRWLHALSKTGGSTVNIRRKISISHRNKTVNTISDDILEHGHLQIWHENSIAVAQFLHERLGIQDLRDLRYAMHTDIEGALAGAVSERFIFLNFFRVYFVFDCLGLMFSPSIKWLYAQLIHAYQQSADDSVCIP